MLDERADFNKLVQSIKDGTYEDLSAIESEGYSSKEIEEPKVEAAAEPETTETIADEPDFEEEIQQIQSSSDEQHPEDEAFENEEKK